MTSATAQQFGRELIHACEHRMLGEAVPRLRKCLTQLSEEEIWRRPNAETVSVGNLVLHLCGNVGQWIIHSLGGAPDHRDRDSEFAERGPIPKEELFRRVAETIDRVHRIFETIDPSSLTEMHRVQGHDVSGIAILVHVVEHFSYHVGQITYVVKSTKAVDMGYYAGVDLNQRGEERI